MQLNRRDVETCRGAFSILKSLNNAGENRHNRSPKSSTARPERKAFHAVRLKKLNQPRPTDPS